MADTVSPRSVAVMKRQIWEAEFQTLAEATVQANYEMELSFQTADFKEGVAHFLEKRAARFTGKQPQVPCGFSRLSHGFLTQVRRP
jgi:enoyl-CoA hydratase/carnithine racemase